MSMAVLLYQIDTLACPATVQDTVRMTVWPLQGHHGTILIDKIPVQRNLQAQNLGKMRAKTRAT